MYYEVIYEDGSHSVACYDDDEEALAAVEAHHARAVAGESAMEGVDRPAGRVVKLFAYDEHPADYRGDIDVSKLSGTAEEMILQMRESESPVVNSGPHESNYKAEGRELDWEG